MPQKPQIIVLNGVFLAIALLFLMAGCRSGEEDDTPTQKMLEAMGGEVGRDENFPGRPVISVKFAKMTDAQLKELAQISTLRSITLAGTAVTDAGIKELIPLKRLASIDLSGTGVTDAGLRELAAARKLHYVALKDTKVTEDGVEQLQKKLPFCTIDH